MGQLSGHGVAGGSFAAAAAAPLVGLKDPACEHSATGLKALAGDDQT